MPIATKKSGFISFAFPDVCKTPSPSGTVPIPYPNIAQLSAAEKTSDGAGGKGKVTVGGDEIILAGQTTVESTTGDEAGSGGGVVKGGKNKGKAEYPEGSGTVFVNGKAVVRMGDKAEQNAGNATGTVLGGVPNVLVG
jgi:uncharacterized Zn-binding protein involved in type VI secretion